jgi:hypothetical protein
VGQKVEERRREGKRVRERGTDRRVVRKGKGSGIREGTDTGGREGRRRAKKGREMCNGRMGGKQDYCRDRGTKKTSEGERKKGGEREEVDGSGWKWMDEIKTRDEGEEGAERREGPARSVRGKGE